MDYNDIEVDFNKYVYEQLLTSLSNQYPELNMDGIRALIAYRHEMITEMVETGVDISTEEARDDVLAGVEDFATELVASGRFTATNHLVR